MLKGGDSTNSDLHPREEGMMTTTIKKAVLGALTCLTSTAGLMLAPTQAAAVELPPCFCTNMQSYLYNRLSDDIKVSLVMD